MNEIFNKIKERILKISEKEEVSKRVFFKNIGSSYSNFVGKSKKSSPSGDLINEISIKYPKINIEWLITGNGEMLKEPIQAAQEVAVPVQKATYTGKYIEVLEENSKLLKEVARLKEENNRLTLLILSEDNIDTKKSKTT
ncbi:MAG: hypothetical protein ACWIPJ_05395 [Polaribacter sp.]